MNQNMVTTNLRVPADDWYEFKNFASELNISVNALVNRLIQKVNIQKSFVTDVVETPVKHLHIKIRKHDPIWDLPKLAKLPNKPMGASEEDKIIYGIR